MLTGALLGAGNIARNGHLPAYLSSNDVSSRLRIIAAADLCPENLAALRIDLPSVRLYADAETLLREEQPDFVDICSPPFTHRSLIESAVEHGCHVLCEKPVTTDLDEALALRRLFELRGLVAFPCHQYHYAPQWQFLRRLIESGEIGELVNGSLTVQRSGANPGNASWQPSWRTCKELAGGGILVDHGAHLFYQLHSLFGAPQQLRCVTEQRLASYDVDDTASVALEYAHASVQIELTWAANGRYSSHVYHGTRGEVRWLDDRIEVDTATGSRTVQFDAGLSNGSAHSDWFAPLLLDFAGRVESGNVELDRLDEAVNVAAYITRAYESAAAGGAALDWQEPSRRHDRIALAAAD